MKRYGYFIYLVAVFLCVPFTVWADQDYSNHNQVTARLEALVNAHPSLVSLESLAQTSGNRDVWVLSIGSGEVTERPAVAVIGGGYGDRLLGTELAVSFAEQLP
ncbi:MAG: M14 family zinc carboxypeptidase, partial [Bacteroidales bacterium]